MIFDLSFLRLELQAAQTGAIPPDLLSHPAFDAIAAHEAELGRPVWDAESFSARFAAAAAGKEGDWGLAPLFGQQAALEEFGRWLEAEQAALTAQIDGRLARFTAVPQKAGLRCVPYAGSYDAGFSPDVGSGAIYLNLPVFPCRESFLDALVHESYHARAVSGKPARRFAAIAADPAPVVQLLYYTAEEGIANFVGCGGCADPGHSAIPLRPAREGAEELSRLLSRCSAGEISGREALDAFLQTDCCYTAGGYLAQAVWEHAGRGGLDLWSARADLHAYYRAFLRTPQGKGWPEIAG